MKIPDKNSKEFLSGIKIFPAYLMADKAVRKRETIVGYYP